MPSCDVTRTRPQQIGRRPSTRRQDGSWGIRVAIAAPIPQDPSAAAPSAPPVPRTDHRPRHRSSVRVTAATSGARVPRRRRGHARIDIAVVMTPRMSIRWCAYVDEVPSPDLEGSGLL